MAHKILLICLLGTIVLAIVYPQFYKAVTYLMVFGVGGALFYSWGKKDGEEEEMERQRKIEEYRKNKM